MPTVSVIVPNYNHAPYLKQRIDSVLNQEYQDFELILLDDCSTDNSRDILAGYADNPHVSHVVFNEKNSGSTFKQWEKGLELAKGRYIWIAESDDYASPHFLRELMPLLLNNSDTVLAFSGSRMVDAEGVPLMKDWDKFPSGGMENTVYRPSDFLRRMLWKNFVYNASMVVFRKDCYHLVDKSFQTYRYCGDWLFWTEIGRQGTVISLNKKLNYFRQHLNKVSPKAEREGLYFFEGLNIKSYIMNLLRLTPLQQMVIMGKVWKQLRKCSRQNPDLWISVPRTFPQLFKHRIRSICCYELDKYFHFSGLKK